MSGWDVARFRLLLRWALYCSVVLLFAITCHKFFRFIGAAPYVAVDDSLADVSSFLSGTGKYGMPATPFENGRQAIRLGSMMTYGPQSFVLGAALDWLFGTSYVVARSIHLLGLAIVTVLAFLTFRKERVAAAAFFSVLLAFVFFNAQWPMVRPDIVTALLLVATIASATWAIGSDAILAWFLTGFMAANAASNHQIAWSVVPAVLLIWVASLKWRGDRKRLWRARLLTFSFLAIGGLAGGLIHLIAIGFRVEQLVEYWLAYAHATAVLGGPAKLGYISVLARHLQAAWGAVPTPIVVLIHICSLFGTVLAGWAFFSRGPSSKKFAALLLPPIIVGEFYQLSLGFYTNFHTGYALPTQITMIWAASAFVATVFLLLEDRRSSVLSFFSNGATAAACILVLGVSWHFAKAETIWERAAAIQVPFSEYSANVLSEVPKGAKVFGDIAFGIQSGTRYNLIDVGEGIYLSSNIKAASLPRFLPDYLVLNRYSDYLAYNSLVRRGEGFYEKLARLTGAPKAKFSLFEGLARWNAEYKLSSIVAAPPYGLTFVYGRTAGSARPGLPNVAVYLPQERRWLKHLGAPLRTEASSHAPLHLELQVGDDITDVHAVSSWSVHLKPGAYLISFDVPARSAEALVKSPCFVTATRSPEVKSSLGDLGFGIPFSFCMPGQEKIYIIVDHQGGELYLSAFGQADRIHLEAIRPIQGFADQTRRDFRLLPPFEDWHVVAKSGKREHVATQYRITGDASRFGYQIVSPRIQFPKHARGRVELDLSPQKGKIKVGVLGYDGRQWISSNASGNVVTFDSQDSDNIQIVIFNNDDPNSHNSVFTLQGAGKLVPASSTRGDYVYALAACSWPGRKPPSYCDGAGPGDEDSRNKPEATSAAPERSRPAGSITPLGDRAWEQLIAPGGQDGVAIRIDGEPISAGAYAAKSVRYQLPKGAVLQAAGTVLQGGLVIGLLDAQERWAVQKAIGLGPFRVSIEAPAAGRYRIVVANNLTGGEKTNHAEVTEIGLVGLDPAKLAIASKPSQPSAKP